MGVDEGSGGGGVSVGKGIGVGIGVGASGAGDCVAVGSIAGIEGCSVGKIIVGMKTGVAEGGS